MSQQSHNPDDHAPWPELGEVLRSSVERIRRTSPPPDSLNRALDRAAKISTKAPARPWILRRVSLFVSSAVAATLLITIGLRSGPPPVLIPGNLPLQSGIGVMGIDAAEATVENVGFAQLAPPRPTPPRGGRMILHPGRVFGAGMPGMEPMTIGIGQVPSNWAAWERVQGTRQMANAMSMVDRNGVESYLRYQTASVIPGSTTWRMDGHPLRTGQIVDPSDNRKLKLQGMYVQVRIEGARARTLVDFIFHNPHDEPVNGIFETALPDGTSPSYFAFFPGNKTNPPSMAKMMPSKDVPPSLRNVRLPTPEVAMLKTDRTCWGFPKVATIVSNLPGSDDHSETTSSASEPARSTNRTGGVATLRAPLGWIPAISMSRVLLAYEETLPIQDGRLLYRYPLPDFKLYNLAVTIQADRSLADSAVVSPGNGEGKIEGDVVTFRRRWDKVVPDSAVVFTATPPSRSLQITCGKHGDGRYVFARVKPDVPSKINDQPFARRAVFLLDTSAGENASRFDRGVKLMKCILETDPALESFNVLTFSTGASWLSPSGWITNSRERREEALAKLDGIVLEGATDLSSAFDKLLDPRFAELKDQPTNCFLLSDGRLNCGETDLPSLIAQLEAKTSSRFRWHCYHLGRNEENAELYSLLTRTGGGTYRCLSEREVPVAAQAHRQECLILDQVAFEGGPEASDVLVAGRRTAIYPGGDLIVAARFAQPGKTTLRIQGRIGEQKITQRYSVHLTEQGDLAGRAWAEVAVASLLALNDPRLDAVALSLAKQYQIVTRVSQFGLTSDPERWTVADPRPLPQELPTLLDRAWQSLGRDVTSHQRREWLKAQLHAWIDVDSMRRDLKQLVEQLPQRELELPDTPREGGLLHQNEADPAYLLARQRDRRAIKPILDEADRRLSLGQVDHAARVLCTLIEEHPNDLDVTRLVCYRLIAMKRPALAVRFLSGVLEQRPRDANLHRILAIALDEAGYPTRAAIHHDVTLTLLGTRGDWLAAAREEYVYLLRRQLGRQQVSEPIRQAFQQRLTELQRIQPSAHHASVTWSSPHANVALSLRQADGTTIQAPEPDSGLIGVMAGPRRLSVTKPGKFEVELKKAPAKSNEEVFASVQIVRHSGTATESIRTHRLLLRQPGQRVGLED